MEGLRAIGRTSSRLSSQTTTRVSSLQMHPVGQLASAEAPLLHVSSCSDNNSTWNIKNNHLIVVEMWFSSQSGIFSQLSFKISLNAFLKFNEMLLG